jgi:mono/diheme cytochrome c family protein
MLRRTLFLTALCVCGVSTLLIGQRGEGPQGSAGPENTPTVRVAKRDYDMEKLVKSGQPLASEDLRKGRNLWIERCAYCHDGVGTPTYNTRGPWLDSDLIGKRGDNAVRDKIMKGSATMPGFQYGLKPAQVDQLLSFLKTISPDEKPTEAQKANKSTVATDL